MQTATAEKIFEEPIEDTEENIEKQKGIFFNPTEWKYFKLEIEDMMHSEREFSFQKAVHNARYLAEIDRRTKDTEAGKNCKTFTAEEWEAFVNEQNLS